MRTWTPKNPIEMSLKIIYGTKKNFAERFETSTATIDGWLKDPDKMNLHIDTIHKHAIEQRIPFNTNHFRRLIRIAR